MSEPPSELGQYQQIVKDLRSDHWPQKYEAFLQSLHTFASKLVHQKVQHTQDREELVQDIVLAVHKSLHTYDDKKPFKPWFYSLVRFKTIDHWRKSKRHRHTSMEDVAEPMDEKARFEDLALMAIDAMDKLAEVPKEQLRILYLAKVEGFSMKEIAKETGKSESAVKVTIHRLMRNIKEDAS